MLAEEIAMLVQDVWMSALQQPLELLSTTDVARLDDAAYTASVHIRGRWQGLFMVTAPAALSRTIAGHMFGIAPDETSEEDLRDAVGEIANMVGGNVKAMLEPPCTLSLPSVYEGDLMDLGLVPPDSETVDALLFETAGHRFIVRLVHESSNEEAAAS